MHGELLYTYTLDFTQVVDHGVALDAMLSGQQPIPPQGARVDVFFEGEATGRLAGKVKGCDFLRVRADGRIDLDIRATIETANGERISLTATGVGTPRADAPIADIKENVQLTTACEGQLWVNNKQVWGVGTVDLAQGKVKLEAYG